MGQHTQLAEAADLEPKGCDWHTGGARVLEELELEQEFGLKLELVPGQLEDSTCSLELWGENWMAPSIRQKVHRFAAHSKELTLVVEVVCTQAVAEPKHTNQDALLHKSKRHTQISLTKIDNDQHQNSNDRIHAGAGIGAAIGVGGATGALGKLIPDDDKSSPPSP